MAASRSAVASIPSPPAGRVGAEARSRGGQKGKAEGEGKWGSDKRREGRGEEEGRKGRREGGRSHVDAPCNYLGRTWRRATQTLLRHDRDALPCLETHEKQLSEGRKVTQGSLAHLLRPDAKKESLTNDVAGTTRQSGFPNTRRTWAQHRPATNHDSAIHETAEPHREASLLLYLDVGIDQGAQMTMVFCLRGNILKERAFLPVCIFPDVCLLHISLLRID